MPRLIDRDTFVGAVTVAVNDVLAEQGLPGLTIRAIAARARCSPAGLYQVFRDRDRMLRIVAHETAVAHRSDVLRRLPAEGVAAFLPGDDDDVVRARAWLGWCELARSAPWLEATTAEAEWRELADLARLFDLRLVRSDLEHVQVLLEGLRVALCRPSRPMRRTQAQELLVAEVDRVLARAGLSDLSARPPTLGAA